MGSKPFIRPPRLAPGCRVALVAPAGPVLERDDLARSEALCAALGFEAVLAPHAGDRCGYLAGADQDRLDDLNSALRDPAVDAVWCIRGGYGVTRILDGVDYQALVRRPKAILGFSDITALLAAVGRCAGVVAFHSPVARASMPAFTRRHFERVLCDGAPPGMLERIPPAPDVLVPLQHRMVTLRGGLAEGPLAGGNLTLLQHLVGTPYFPDLDGAILVLEDVNEALYRIDRTLAHLRMVGALDRLAGVAVGQFSELTRHTGDGAFGLDEVLAHYFRPLEIPVALGFPVGHLEAQWTLPLGVRARLDADQGEVTLLEGGVQ